MRIHKIIPITKAEGPGNRFAIWVQGCPHHCEGCFAIKTWDYNGGYSIKLSEIISSYKKVSDKIEGVTFLGGEPFEQARELSKLATIIKKDGKNLITFTGYSYSEIIENGDKHKINLIKNTDILIDGKFEKNRLDFSRPLVGSSNQNILFLSDRISEKDFYSYKNRIEIRTDKCGNIHFNGMGDFKKIKYKI